MNRWLCFRTDLGHCTNRSAGLYLTITMSLSLFLSSIARGSSESAETFLNHVRANFSTLESQEKPLSRPPYVSITELIRGQDEISVDNTQAKLNDRISEGIINYEKSDKTYSFRFDNERSAIAADDPIMVAKGRQGYVVVDGHHEVYLSLYVGAKTVPVKIVTDLSHLNPLQFWNELKRRQMIYLEGNPLDLSISPPKIDQAADNPVRYLVSLLGMKVKFTDGKISKIKGAENPIWIKVDSGVPFIEFHIADILTKAGLKYNRAWGEKIPDDVIEIARNVLISSENPIIKEAFVLKTASEAKLARNQIKYAEKFIKSHRSCQTIFN